MRTEPHKCRDVATVDFKPGPAMGALGDRGQRALGAKSAAPANNKQSPAGTAEHEPERAPTNARGPHGVHVKMRGCVSLGRVFAKMADSLSESSS